jgi:hypothetical protein
MTAEQREQRHRALSELYRASAPMGCIHHSFAGGLAEQGLELLVARHREYAENFNLAAVLEMNAANMGPSYEQAIETALKLGRPPRVVNELKRWVSALSVAAGPKYKRARLRCSRRCAWSNWLRTRTCATCSGSSRSSSASKSWLRSMPAGCPICAWAKRASSWCAAIAPAR